MASNKNLINLATRAELAKALGETELYDQSIAEGMQVGFSANQADRFISFLLDQVQHEQAIAFSRKAYESYPDTWYLGLDHAIALYVGGQPEAAVEVMDQVKTPDWFSDRYDRMKEEMEEGSFSL